MFLKAYLVTLSIFFTIDMAWLGLVAKNFYAKEIGFLMKTNINWVAAISFYLLFVLGLVVFIITPSLSKHSLTNAVIMGGLFGLICYATYDLTNLATIKDWPLSVTIIDLLWGTVLAATVSTLSYLILLKT